MPVIIHSITSSQDHTHVGLALHHVPSVTHTAALLVAALWVGQWIAAMRWISIHRVDAANVATLVVADVYKNSKRICNCKKKCYLCKMEQYANQQISNNLKEVTDITKKVCANVRGIRLTVSPITTEVMTVCDLTHVLDVGEEYSFFYSNEKEALADQEKLCNHLRIRGVAVAKVIRQKPISINSK
jgi:hypothetical protein